MQKTTTGEDPMATCPMAAMCKGMMAKKTAGFGFLLMIPGALLVILGVLVAIEPRILIWLVAAALIILGLSSSPPLRTAMVPFPGKNTGRQGDLVIYIAISPESGGDG